MKMTIAVPVTAGVLSSHFGHCEEFYFADVEDKKIVAERTIVPPEHEPGLYPKWVKEQGSDLVIGGGMGQKARNLFAENGVQIIVGGPHKEPRMVVEDYLNDKLETTENSCDH